MAKSSTIPNIFNPISLIWVGGVILLSPFRWFSLNNSETVKAVTLAWHFSVFSNFLLEAFVQNLVSLSRPSLQILVKPQTGGISDFRIFAQSFIKENRHHSRTSHDIHMKL